MNKHLTGYVVALALGVGAGFALKPDTPNIQTSNSVMVSPSTSQSIDKGQSSPDSATAPIIEQTANPTHTTLSTLLQTTDLNQHLSIAYQLSENADQEQLMALLDSLKEQQTDSNLTVAARVFLLRLSAFSSQAAVEKYQQLYDTPSKAQQDLVYMLYHQYGMADFEGALNSIPGLALKNMQRNLFFYLLQDKHFRDSPKLIAAAKAFSPELNLYVNQITSESAQQWFEQLLTMDLKAPHSRGQIHAALRRWVSEDPQQAFAYLTELQKENPQADRWLKDLLGIWAETAPEDALNTLIANGSDMALATTMLSKLAYRSPAKALQLFEQYKTQLDSNVQEQIYQSWLRQKPAEALDYIRQLDEQQQVSLLNNDQILHAFAKKDPQTTFKLAQKWGMFKKPALERTLTEALAEIPFEQSSQFWQELEPSREKDLLFAQLTRSLAKQDIAAAQKWLLDHGETSARVPMATSYFLYELSQKSPQQAADYALSIEDEKARSQAASSAASYWYNKDPDGAIKWATGLSSGRMKDTVLTILIYQVNRHDKASAKKLASAIAEPSLRKQLSELVESQ